MLRFVAARLIWGVIVVLGTATVAFIVLRVVPGDPVQLVLQGGPTTPQLVAQITGQFHLNDPLIVQYLLYLRDLLQGNLGISILNGQSVGSQIGTVLPHDLATGGRRYRDRCGARRARRSGGFVVTLADR